MFFIFIYLFINFLWWGRFDYFGKKQIKIKKIKKESMN